MFATHVDLPTLSNYRQRGLLRQADHPTLPLSIYNYTDRLLYGPRSGWDAITLQCRGLVVHSGTGAIVARSFDKFFKDADEKSADGTSAAARYDVYEKVDGSLGILFYYRDTQQWIIASRGSFTSQQAQHAQEQVDRCRLDEHSFDRDCSYIVEIVYPTNRIVVDYGKRDELILLAVYQQHAHGWSELYPLPSDVKQRWTDSGLGSIIHQYTADELQSLPLTRLHQFDWPNKEGFVVRFESGVRLKVKFGTYVQLHKAQLDFMTPTALLAAYRAGQSVEAVLDVAPDELHSWIRVQWTGLEQQYEKLRRDLMDAVHDVVGNVEMAAMSQKQYAASALSHPYQWKNEMFLMRRMQLAKDGKDIELQAALFAALSRRMEVVEDGTVVPRAVAGVDDGPTDAAVDDLVDDMKAASI